MIANPNVKINLGLNVLFKREDGFHELETLFVPYFGMSDTLEIVTGDDFSRTSSSLFSRYGEGRLPSSQGGLGCDGFFGVAQEQSLSPRIVQGISEDGRLMMTIAREEGVDWDPLKDLCAKAYFLLSEDFDLPPVKIFLEKTSPVGAGLGGGSADAAFTLKMLNELCSLQLSDEALAGYAARLGSDCAFFIYNRPMIGRGRGEVLTEFILSNIDFGAPGQGDAAYKLEVIFPQGISVSTADAYRGISPSIPSVSLEQALSLPVEEWDGILKNDFETTVFEKYPELSAIKRSLYDSGAVYASMSGSGSALFGLYRQN